ncbi:hypothetical protein AB6E91_10045 [Staphylococcus saprophyticus]|uniref:hypothetical protein n=1 Tax=Staphylococcus saprophyticus TaxID=29385 RepID=UPI0034DD56CE
MKDKESNQNFTTPILLLIGVVIAILIVCYLVIDALIGFKNIKEVIPIIISIFSLFATFGGAYFGAKISGDKAREQAQAELNSKIEYDFYLKNYEMIKILEEKVNPIINELSKNYVKYKDYDCFSKMFISNLIKKNCDLLCEVTNTINITEHKFYEIKLNKIIEISKEIKVIFNDICESSEIKKAIEEHKKTRSKSSERKIKKDVYRPTQYTLQKNE